MGRFADLCATLAAEADEGPDGLALAPELRERLADEGWASDDVDDASQFVRLSLLQMELTQAADSLSGALVEWLGDLAEESSFSRLASGEATLSVDRVSGIARRVTHLEEILAVVRDDDAPDLTGLIELRRRLAALDS